MATISNHYSATHDALLEFGIPEKMANRISSFASVYADNPEGLTTIRDFIREPSLGLKITANNLTSTSSMQYFCEKPVLFICGKGNTINVNYWATKNSQDENDPKETVRHAMLAKTELGEGIKGGKMYGVKEEHVEGINSINEKYAKRFFIRSYKNRVLELVDFRIVNASYMGRGGRVQSEYDAPNYSRYRTEINSYVVKMEEIAMKRGIHFGWQKIFKAAEKATKGAFLSWEVDPDDWGGNSGLALLGVGIHAIQDATIHHGENMDHYGKHSLLHYKNDIFIEKKLEQPTRNAIIVFLLMSENFNFIRATNVQDFFKNLDIENLGLSNPQKEQLNEKIVKKFTRNF